MKQWGIFDRNTHRFLSVHATHDSACEALGRITFGSSDPGRYAIGECDENSIRGYQSREDFTSESGPRHEKFKVASDTQLRTSSVEDDYRLLGLEPGASKDALKAAWRELAVQHHPDKVIDAEAKKRAERRFCVMDEAYHRILDALADGSTSITPPAQETSPLDDAAWMRDMAQKSTRHKRLPLWVRRPVRWVLVPALWLLVLVVLPAVIMICFASGSEHICYSAADWAILAARYDYSWWGYCSIGRPFKTMLVVIAIEWILMCAIGALSNKTASKKYEVD